MTAFLKRWLVFLALFAAAGAAHAVYSCTVTSSGWNRAYDPALATTSTQQSSVTLSCSRASSDSNSMPYMISADNGLSNNGINNRGALNGQFIRYDNYQDSSCVTQWRGNSANSSFNGNLLFGTNLNASVTHAYWGCIIAGQSLPAGIYTDLITMTVKYGPNPQLTASNTFNVNISTPWTCSIPTPPGPVAFTYVSYGAAATASTSFTVNCTTYLPYTLALDRTSGTLVGLDYTLTLGTTSATGTGVPQTIQINGNMVSGQAGTCANASCSGSTTHTLILTY
jgi:spore coat protein U-like protein